MKTVDNIGSYAARADAVVSASVKSQRKSMRARPALFSSYLNILLGLIFAAAETVLKRLQHSLNDQFVNAPCQSRR